MWTISSDEPNNFVFEFCDFHEYPGIWIISIIVTMLQNATWLWSESMSAIRYWPHSSKIIALVVSVCWSPCSLRSDKYTLFEGRERYLRVMENAYMEIQTATWIFFLPGLEQPLGDNKPSSWFLVRVQRALCFTFIKFYSENIQCTPQMLTVASACTVHTSLWASTWKPLGVGILERETRWKLIRSVCTGLIQIYLHIEHGDSCSTEM